MPDILTFYSNKFRKLRIDRARGNPAPHKPLLLLAVIDLIEQGAIQANKIEPSPLIVESFLKYWNLLSLEKPRIYLPFYHLKSDNFWHLHAKAGQENLLSTISQFKSMTQLASVIDFANLDDDLFLLLHNLQAREVLRNTIIEIYFPDKAELFRAAISENQEINVIENLLLENAEKKDFDSSKIVADVKKREKAFSRAIMRLYDYTCAACHYRIVTLNGESAVDAAHIFPFKDSFDNSIGNGILLCKLHHWSFDRGLFSIDDNYKIVVASTFSESGNENFSLHKLQAKLIFLPKEKPFRPSITMLRWHRENQLQN
jgi:putative restriction endonuclease